MASHMAREPAKCLASQMEYATLNSIMSQYSNNWQNCFLLFLEWGDTKSLATEATNCISPKWQENEYGALVEW